MAARVMAARVGTAGRTALTLGLVAAVLAASIAVALLVGRDTGERSAVDGSTETPAPRSAPSANPDPTSGERLTEALAVLRGWDDRRAAAWTSGDVAALRGLYAPGAPAGRRDAAMLRAWVDRGVTPSRLETQVLAAELRAAGAGRLRLLVTDRAVVTLPAARSRRAGPTLDDAPSTRLVVLRQAPGDDDWRVAAVYARPLATTASTSGSRNS